jgi:hypothetical protein
MAGNASPDRNTEHHGQGKRNDGTVVESHLFPCSGFISRHKNYGCNRDVSLSAFDMSTGNRDIR